jgi:hypothetical protein
VSFYCFIYPHFTGGTDNYTSLISIRHALGVQQDPMRDSAGWDQFRNRSERKCSTFTTRSIGYSARHVLILIRSPTRIGRNAVAGGKVFAHQSLLQLLDL